MNTHGTRYLRHQSWWIVKRKRYILVLCIFVLKFNTWFVSIHFLQILSVFHLKFYNVWSVNNLNLCINIISAIFQNDITYLHPYTKLQCSNGETNVTKYTIQRVGDRIDCPEGRQIINSTQSSFCGEFLQV